VNSQVCEIVSLQFNFTCVCICDKNPLYGMCYCVQNVITQSYQTQPSFDHYYIPVYHDKLFINNTDKYIPILWTLSLNDSPSVNHFIAIIVAIYKLYCKLRTYTIECVSQHWTTTPAYVSEVMINNIMYC